MEKSANIYLSLPFVPLTHVLVKHLTIGMVLVLGPETAIRQYPLKIQLHKILCPQKYIT